MLSGRSGPTLVVDSAGRVSLATTSQESGADASAEDLFLIKNPAGGRYTLGDGTTPVYPMERRDSTRRTGFLFFCVTNGVGVQLDHVSVDSLIQTRFDDTGGHVESGHGGQDSVGHWDPDRERVTDGVFESTFFTYIVSQDELKEFYWTVLQPGSPCEGRQFRDTLLTGTCLEEPLVQVTDSAHLTFPTTCSPHFNVNYMTARTEQRLVRAADLYHRWTRDQFRLNAASLIYGGLYDIAGKWDISGGTVCGGSGGH